MPTPAPDDWRRQSQETYLRGRAFRRAAFIPPRPGSDHDHCAFCWSKFMLEGGDLVESFCTEDGEHWVCPACFEDFREELELHDADSEAPIIEWSGGGGGIDKAFVLILLWGIAAASVILGIRALVLGQDHAWILTAFGAIVFGPFALGFTIIMRKSVDQRITVNPGTREIAFERAFLMAGFLPRVASFGCSIAEIRRVDHLRGRRGFPDWLYIHLPHGRVILHSASDNFHELSKYLVAAAPKGRVPLTTRHWFPHVLGGLIVFTALAIALWRGWLP